MAESSKTRSNQAQIRSSAFRHAQNIEEKKRLKARVADLVLDAYDLPTSPGADPTHPSVSDVGLFRECLRLFQPSDLDDLIKERNIDDRCGYALCPKPNQKIIGGSEKVWNQKGGKDFKIVNRAEMERWCSTACGTRTAFVRAQLSSEPSWLRDTQNNVRLLDEVGSANDLSGAAKVLAEGDVDKSTIERLEALSLERGEERIDDVSDRVEIVENQGMQGMSVPPNKGGQMIEGHLPRRVRFASNENLERGSG